MSEFSPSNAALDAAISKSNSPSDIRELAVRSLQDAGMISRNRDDGNYGVRATGRQQLSEPTPDASLAANGFKFERAFRYHPESGRRSLMLRANTIEELNALQIEMEKTV